MVWKDIVVSGMYPIDRRIPLISCKDRVIPARNPMFHNNEIDLGVGKSAKDPFKICSISFCVVMCILIKRWTKLFARD